MILAIDTATPVCSVAIMQNNGRILEKRVEGRGVHSEKLFAFVRELLEAAETTVDELDAVLFSNGPGSYTGLRIGASGIKGLLFQKAAPLFTLTTLTCYAVPFIDRCPAIIHSVIDARREHLYHSRIVVEPVGIDSSTKPANGGYRKTEHGASTGALSLIRTDAVIKEIAQLKEEIQPGDIVAGTGWERIGHKDHHEIEWAGSETISAANLIHAWNHKALKPLFKEEAVETFEPDYLTLSQVNNSIL